MGKWGVCLGSGPQGLLNFGMLSPTFSKPLQGSGLTRASNVIQTGYSGPNLEPLWLWIPCLPCGVLSHPIRSAWGQPDAPAEPQAWHLKGCPRDP